MNENPYSQLFKVFDKEVDSSIRLGIVKSLKPFVVEIGELVLDKDNLLVNEELLEYERKIEFQYDIDTETSQANSHSHIVKYDDRKNKDIKVKTRLKVRDTVLILKDNQTYIVVCKVVNV